MRALQLRDVSRCLIVALALAGSPAHGATWNESINGDLSGDRFNPSTLSLDQGINSLSATTGLGATDREFVTLGVPTGASLSGIRLISYAGGDGTGFLGIQAGTQMTVNPDAQDPTGLLGYTHFGSGPGNVGSNLLPSMGTASGAIGFTPPLPGGPYTLWIQQLGSPATYEFAFDVVPEPGLLGLLGLTGAILGLVRGSRRSVRS